MSGDLVSADVVRADVVSGTPLLRFDNVSKTYQLRRESARRRPTRVRAVAGVSFELHAGETLGLVGESGCGKSTLGRMALTMLAPDSGRVFLDGLDTGKPRGAARRRMRRRVQGVFQDPTGALDPRRTVRQSLAEPLTAGGMRRPALQPEIERLLSVVGLDPQVALRHPRQLSGGQRQRVVIARALASSPAVLVADEPVSALDVSVQAQIINLFRDLQTSQGTASLFISHDLAVVAVVADRVAVMYLGEIVELGPALKVLEEPAHPYTLLLRTASAATPAARSADAEREATDAPNQPPTVGCPFAPRCPRADHHCQVETPMLRVIADGRSVACHHPTN